MTLPEWEKIMTALMNDGTHYILRDTAAEPGTYKIMNGLIFCTFSQIATPEEMIPRFIRWHHKLKFQLWLSEGGSSEYWWHCVQMGNFNVTSESLRADWEKFLNADPVVSQLGAVTKDPKKIKWNVVGRTTAKDRPPREWSPDVRKLLA